MPVASADPAKGLEVLEVSCNQARLSYACEDLAEYHAKEPS